MVAEHILALTRPAPSAVTTPGPAAHDRARLQSVCRVTQTIFPDIVGGMPIQVHEMSQAQARAGLRVEVHTVDYGKPQEARLEEDLLYTIRRHRRWLMPWDIIGTAGNPFAPSLFAATLRSDAQVVHCHSHLFFPSFLGGMAARIRGKPLVVTVHGVRAVRDRVSNTLQELWMRSLARLLFRAADRIICLTRPDAEEIRQYGADPRKIAVLSNGFDASRFSPSDAPRERRVVWTGRFVEEKGLLYLIEAWERVHAAFPQHRLVLVGDGPQRAAVEEAIRLRRLQGSIEILGRRRQDEIAAELRRAELFVLPSIQEGFPKSLLEAMACGTPVVTTTSLAEIVGPAGRTVPVREADALAATIIAILRDPADRRRMGELAALHAREHFSWETLEAKIAQTYLEAINARD